MEFTPKQIRQFLQMTQQDVADECGVCKKTVARFERREGACKEVAEWFEKAKIRVEEMMNPNNVVGACDSAWYNGHQD